MRTKHFIKNLYLRWKYGAGCCDTYSLDYFLAKRIVGPLKCFKKDISSWPNELGSTEKWEETIDKMIWSMESVINDESPDFFEPKEKWLEECKKYGDRQQEGLELFGKYFTHLWW